MHRALLVTAALFLVAAPAAAQQPPADSSAWVRVFQRYPVLRVSIDSGSIRRQGEQRFAWQRIEHGSQPGPTPTLAESFTHLEAWTQFDCAGSRFRFLRTLYRNADRTVEEDSLPEAWRTANSDMWAPWHWACAAARVTHPLAAGGVVPPDAPARSSPPLGLLPAEWVRLAAWAPSAPTSYHLALSRAEGPASARSVWWKEHSRHQNHVRGRPWDTRYQRLTVDCRARTVAFGPTVYVSGGDVVAEGPAHAGAPVSYRRTRRDYWRLLMEEVARRTCRAG